ncbi:basic leucine zipper transcriptional factor ATF-like 3 [Polyodon spathula]|uniref:basic leucine zipper transcriptional factor ATF-like 3 n=1 Tax=Polyodon spathula TaxID=7913 RepID=UPI001B7D959D|nr:basic leucine zipper transcriptional factor ATF-like 3 [Polyodon spathula]
MSESDFLQEENDLFHGCESFEDNGKRLKRREKNRVAAQRSRKKQMQKADKIHEEYKCLEYENCSLKKDVEKLTDELRHLTEALKCHEPICPLIHCAMNLMSVPRPEVIMPR